MWVDEKLPEIHLTVLIAGEFPKPALLSSGEIDELDAHARRSPVATKMTPHDPPPDDELRPVRNREGDPQVLARLEEHVGADEHPRCAEIVRFEEEWFSTIIEEADLLQRVAPHARAATFI